MKKILIFGVLLLAVQSIAAYDVKVDDIHYNLDQEHMTASVKGCEWWISGISIPESIEAKDKEYIVTCIADSAFMNNGNLSGVDIPSTVVEIGKMAFRSCSRLSFAEIPASVKSIGEMAFAGCSSIDRFVVDAENPNYCAEEGILYDKRQKRLIQCPMKKTGEVVVPDFVVEICTYAFHKCTGVWSVILPNSVRIIGDKSFDNNDNLVEVTMGTGVQTVGHQAFDQCKNLKNIYCQAATPPTAYDDTFDYTWIEYAKLHVLSSSIATYKKTRPWNWMDEIVALTQREIEVGIEEVGATSQNEEYYTLDGKKAPNGTKGIKVVKQVGKKAKKVVY